jgi:hypothetical protein
MFRPSPPSKTPAIIAGERRLLSVSARGFKYLNLTGGPHPALFLFFFSV